MKQEIKKYLGILKEKSIVSYSHLYLDEINKTYGKERFSRFLDRWFGIYGPNAVPKI